MDELRKSIQSHNLEQQVHVELMNKSLDLSKLTKKIITDKNGHKTTKWVSNEPKLKQLSTSQDKYRTKISIDNLSTIWDKAYGEDFTEVHEALYDYLEDNDFTVGQLSNAWAEVYQEDFSKVHKDVYQQLNNKATTGKADVSMKVNDLEAMAGGVLFSHGIQGNAKYYNAKQDLKIHDDNEHPGFSRETIKRQNDIKVKALKDAAGDYKKNLIDVINNKTLKKSEVNEPLSKGNLVKKVIVDKNGKRTTKWVKPGEAEPIKKVEDSKDSKKPKKQDSEKSKSSTSDDDLKSTKPAHKFSDDRNSFMESVHRMRGGYDKLKSALDGADLSPKEEKETKAKLDKMKEWLSQAKVHNDSSKKVEKEGGAKETTGGDKDSEKSKPRRKSDGSKPMPKNNEGWQKAHDQLMSGEKDKSGNTAMDRVTDKVVKESRKMGVPIDASKFEEWLSGMDQTNMVKTAYSPTKDVAREFEKVQNKQPKKPSFADVLDNPKAKSLIEGIEEYTSDLKSNPKSKEHIEGRDNFIKELKEKFNYTYEV